MPAAQDVTLKKIHQRREQVAALTETDASEAPVGADGTDR
jgi:hypothetical protein